MKSAPYATLLAKRFAAGWRPSNGTIFIAAGPRAWSIARGWASEPSPPAFFAIPDDADYDLRVVRGFDCIVLARGLPESAQRQIAVALVTAGATLALIVAEKMVSFRPLRAAA